MGRFLWPRGKKRTGISSTEELHRLWSACPESTQVAKSPNFFFSGAGAALSSRDRAKDHHTCAPISTDVNRGALVRRRPSAISRGRSALADMRDGCVDSSIEGRSGMCHCQGDLCPRAQREAQVKYRGMGEREREKNE